MRKVLLLAVFLGVAMVASVFSKTISVEELGLQQVRPGTQPEYLVALLGSPSEISEENGCMVYNYNEGFRVYYADGRFMSRMVVTGQGMLTPSGVGVGMPAGRLSVYGGPAEVKEAGGEPQEFLKSFTPCHLHMSDFGTRKHMPAGEGDFDWKAIKAVLEADRYQGLYTLEPGYRFYLDDTEAKLAKAYRFLEENFGD